MTVGEASVVAAAVAAAVFGSIRWLRVAQREHYMAGSVSRFAVRWWSAGILNMLVVAVALVGVVGVWWSWPFGWLSLVLAFGPAGLSLRGTTSPLRWTGRLKRLAALVAVSVAAAAGVAIATEEAGWVVAAAVLLPILFDLAMAALTPIEVRLGHGWVTKAGAKLAASGAKVVAITGSYGKTTTKGYVHHLLAGALSPVSSPASFNNRMGLARAINERLIPGTGVFVAEMGTYGKGEIAELCGFVPPDVGVITSIGPVHLERFGSEEAIVEAKREIIANAPVAILNVDHPLLAKVADEERARREVVRVSGLDPAADFSVVGGILRANGTVIAEVPADAFGVNLAIAAAVASHFDVSLDEIARRVSDVPGADHRRQQSTSERGFTVIDDTYNSNPAGAAAALDLLCSLPGEGRRVVVTPGMVELGPRQFEENRRFAEAVGTGVTDLVIVNVTNRAALLKGSESSGAAVTVVGSRQEAVEWVRSQLGPGDAVLYENDLPDHYP